MITCKLIGGMGNQLFSISAAIGHAVAVGDDYAFDFDSCYTPLQGNPSNHYRSTIFKNLPSGKDTNCIQWKEPSHEYHPIPHRKNITLDGYFQSEKYFLHCQDLIKNSFFLEKAELGFPYATLHIRRGDYLNNPNIHPCLSLDYYKEAIKLVRSDVILVFSDNLDWAEQNLKNERCKFVECSDIETLSLLTGAEESIIANSTFSWWGAWLKKSNGITVAPSVWFGPDGPSYRDIVPDRWVKI